MTQTFQSWLNSEHAFWFLPGVVLQVAALSGKLEVPHCCQSAAHPPDKQTLEVTLDQGSSRAFSGICDGLAMQWCRRRSPPGLHGRSGGFPQQDRLMPTPAGMEKCGSACHFLVKESPLWPRELRPTSQDPCQCHMKVGPHPK